jgi:ADP-ribose pyrophosphatase YjhB (NUDIX family)
MELGESIADAAVREVTEETGLTVELTGLVGIYTDPGHVMAYDDGEVRQEFSVCFHARVTGGEPREDGSETKEVRWVEPTAVAELNIHPSMRRRIDDALGGPTTPQIV